MESVRPWRTAPEDLVYSEQTGTGTVARKVTRARCPLSLAGIEALPSSTTTMLATTTCRGPAASDHREHFLR